jgi:hypothetical protein
MARRLDEVLSAGGELVRAVSASGETPGGSHDAAEIGSGVLAERAATPIELVYEKTTS